MGTKNTYTLFINVRNVTKIVNKIKKFLRL